MDILGGLADVASLVALLVSMVAVWKARSVSRLVERIVDQDQQTKLFLNFKRYERSLHKQLLAGYDDDLEFLRVVARCKADAEELSALHRSRIRPDAHKLRRKIRWFELQYRVSTVIRARGWRRQACGNLSRAISHFTQRWRIGSCGCRRRNAMIEPGKTEKFLQRLIVSTKSGKVRWTPEDPPDAPRTGTEEYVGVVYTTTLSGRLFQLSEVRYRYYTDEDAFVWTDTVALEIVDWQGRVFWRFPHSREILDLLEVVQYAASDIEQLMDEVLADNSQ